ncbi:unnamed protein product [Microthlaspi erraticum]|uniref:CCHC-type domain-containing protein n=1 Tax=Microthlaspi erraticum TaxID=1685480 RepID=A0A6D2IYH6_9BRAS|nr:unnamed protein product [Microthlaspi erraticum]
MEQLVAEEGLEAAQLELEESIAIPTGPITRSQTKALNQEIGKVLSCLSQQETKPTTLSKVVLEFQFRGSSSIATRSFVFQSAQTLSFQADLFRGRIRWRLQDEDSTVPWPEQSRRVYGLGKEVRIQFQLHNIIGVNRVKLAVSEFNDYALRWWEQIILAREIGGAFEITTWEEMKRIMRQRFVPGHYQRELHSKLRKLTQGSKSVEEYYQEMEVMLLRANVMKTARPLCLDSLESRTERTPPARTRDLKCFRCQGFGHYASDCLNKKVMIIRANGEIESEEDPEPEKPEKKKNLRSMRLCLSKANFW